MSLTDIISCTAILDGDPPPGKAGIVGRLLTLLSQAGHTYQAEVPAIRDAGLHREKLGSTGIGRGLAIPHAKHPGVQRSLGILVVCRPPVEFEALDGEPVDLVALILSPSDRPGQHLG